MSSIQAKESDDLDFEIEFETNGNGLDLGLGVTMSEDVKNAYNTETTVKYLKENAKFVKEKVSGVENKVEGIVSKIDKTDNTVADLQVKVAEVEELGKQVKKVASVATQIEEMQNKLEVLERKHEGQVQQTGSIDFDLGLPHELIENANAEYEKYQNKIVGNTEKNGRKQKWYVKLKQDFLDGLVAGGCFLARLIGILLIIALCIFLTIIVYYVVNSDLVAPEGLAWYVEKAKWLYAGFCELLKKWQQ